MTTEISSSPTLVHASLPNCHQVTESEALTIRDGSKHMRLPTILQVPSRIVSLFMKVLFCGVHVKDRYMPRAIKRTSRYYQIVLQLRRPSQKKSLSQQLQLAQVARAGRRILIHRHV